MTASAFVKGIARRLWRDPEFRAKRVKVEQAAAWGDPTAKAVLHEMDQQKVRHMRSRLQGKRPSGDQKIQIQEVRMKIQNMSWSQRLKSCGISCLGLATLLSACGLSIVGLLGWLKWGEMALVPIICGLCCCFPIGLSLLGVIGSLPLIGRYLPHIEEPPEPKKEEK